MKTATPIVAIIVIALLIAYALHQHVDGVILAGGIAIIGGICGYVVPRRKPPTNHS